MINRTRKLVTKNRLGKVVWFVWAAVPVGFPSAAMCPPLEPV